MARKRWNNTYSRLTIDVIPYEEFPFGLKSKHIAKVSQLTEEKYNSCLLNRYRDGNDYSDKEVNKFIPTVATLSLGGSHRFYLRAKEDIKTELHNGDLCNMSGKCQDLYSQNKPKFWAGFL